MPQPPPDRALCPLPSATCYAIVPGLLMEGQSSLRPEEPPDNDARKLSSSSPGRLQNMQTGTTCAVRCQWKVAD